MPQSKALEALAKTVRLPPQSSAQIRRGVTTRRTAGGIPVTRFHYSAMPERDPEISPDWKAKERRAYTSQASWDREQEIIDEAGGGELVFADTLITHWKKIIIEDPKWRPDPNWRIEAGFDWGKTNPTALERCYIDREGTIYFCGEYYTSGREIWENAPVISQMADIRKISACYADPTIFHQTMQQSAPQRPGQAQERAKSINDLYVEQGIELFSPFVLDRSDVSFAARLMLHWANLDQRAPSVKIVCRTYSERPQYGLHNWDSPNLLWELMRMRRQKLTATQLMNRNASEAIVQKDNHAADACKYVLMTRPEPTPRSFEEIAAAALAPLVQQQDFTSAYVRYLQMKAEAEGSNRPIYIGRRRGRRY